MKKPIKKPKTSAPVAAKTISPARLAAFQILLKVEREKSFASALLPVFEAELEPRDRGLCHAITLGVLRRQMFLDRLIDAFTNGKKIDREVRIILRMALFQLRFMDRIPPHAAINDAVSLVQKAKKMSAKGFVNAVLRRSTREEAELAFSDETERLSVETSHPRWLLERWIAAFGGEPAASIARSDNEVGELEFRFTDVSTEDERAALNLPDSKNDLKYLHELAADGKIYFQDRGSRIVGDAVKLGPDERFLDLCAAPGSKTTQIAAAHSGLNCVLVAGELYPGRARLLQENCVRQAVSGVNVIRYDALNGLPFADETFDAVLVDAPCSGTGTLRHNPEIRYSLTEADIVELSAKQLAILRAASKVLRSGGRLIYSTCSLERDENEDVCGHFLSIENGFRCVKPEVDEKFMTAEGYARTFPDRDGTDGFFIAVFEKN